MKNKNLLSRTRKSVYFFGCLILAIYFVASPHKAEASFLGDVWNSIVKIVDFSDKTASPDGTDALSSSNTAAVIASVTSSDITRAKELSDEIFKINADPLLRDKLLADLAIERETLVKELMRKDPELFLSLAIRESQRNSLPLNIQPYIEKQTTLTSKIEVIHIDDFANPQNSRFDYFLKDIDGETKINFYPTDPLYLVSGAVVKASGFKLGNNFVSQTNRTNFAVQETPALESTGDQKTLVILLDFANSGAHPFTKEKAYDLVFNDQFQKFYKEQSYNQVSFSGEVVDWYKLSNNKDYYEWCPVLDDSELGQIVKDRGINIANYKRVVFLPNSGDSGGRSDVGTFDHRINGIYSTFSEACVGLDSFDDNSWWGAQPFKWSNFDYVMSHELGHSLGVFHANGWDCGDKSLGDNCTHREYGNYFDTMGSNNRALHFNAFYKEILGWIKPSQILEINKSGTYSINTLEKDSAIKFAKISNYAQKDTPYYLEYRKSFGFDSRLKEQDISSNQNGLFINNKLRRYGADISRLIDASPTTDSWLNDTVKATLNSNATFADPDNGITIDRVSNPTDNSIDFRVTYNKPSDVDLTLDKTSDGNDTVKLYAWRDIFNDYGETVDSDFTDGEIKTLRNDWHYKLSAIPDSSSLGFSGWIGCDSQTQGNSWTDADGVIRYSKPSSGENACFVELSDESKQIEVDFTEPSEISASPNPVNSGKSATLTWTASSGPGDCYLYSPTDNLKTIKSTAFYLDTNSASRFYKGPGYYATVVRNSNGATANLTAPTDYTLTCDIDTLNNAVSYNLKVGIASSGSSSSSSSISYGDIGVDTVFNYTGGVQQYLVPSGVTNVNIKASGAQGNGLGGESSAIVAVTSGETLYIYAGGQPPERMGGWNGGGNGGSTSWGAYGGGGGGASDVRQGGTALTNRIIVAGGGGGRGSNDYGGTRMGGNGGIAGGVAGSNGGSGQNDPPVSGGGGGGTQTSGGNGGTAGGDGGNGGATGNSGAVGNGGAGAIGPSVASGGGGGGGGYFGGGGGGVNYQSAGGGGGGSSYVTGARTSMTGGVRSGHGQVAITPFLPSSSSSSLSSANHTAITELATNIASTSATLNGAVNPKGESVYYQFFYRKESESSASNQKTSYIFAGSGSSDISVSAQISGLSPGTKYVYQLYAYSYTTSKAVNGDLKSFTTSSSSSAISSISSSAVSSSISSSSSSSKVSLSNGLVGYWKFDETSGTTTADSSGKNNNGTVSGGAVFSAGKINSAINFDGVNDYVNAVNNSTLTPTGDMALSAWVKFDQLSTEVGRSQKIIYKGHSVTPWESYELAMDATNQIVFNRAGGTSSYAGAGYSGAISKGVWYHIVGVSQSSSMKIYINGTDSTSWSYNDVSGSFLQSSNMNLRIGNSPWNSGWFKGAVDEVRLYNRALTSTDIAGIYNYAGGGGYTASSSSSSSSLSSISSSSSQSSPSSSSSISSLSSSSVMSSASSIADSLSSGLVAQYRFDDGSAKDSLGNNRDGSVVGATSSAGKVGNALSFNGTSNYVSVPRMNYNEMSVSAWFYHNVDDTTNADAIWGGWYWTSNPSNREGFDLRFTVGAGNVFQFILETIGATTTEKSSTYAMSPSTGVWHHAVGTYDSMTGNQKLYVDGVLRDTDFHPAGATIKPLTQYADMRIGYSRVNKGYFNGLIDEVKIYNRALTPEEVSRLYSSSGISCDTDGSCAVGYKTNWLNQIGAVLESIGSAIKQLFTIKKQY